MNLPDPYHPPTAPPPSRPSEATPLPRMHLIYLAIALLGHFSAWLCARIVASHGAAAFIGMAVLWTVASLWGTFGIFWLSDLYFTRARKAKRWYYALALASLVLCIFTLLFWPRVETEEERKSRYYQDYAPYGH